ncbi:hypothetical protein INT48_004757, partial [Thamnidium elegans]
VSSAIIDTCTRSITTLGATFSGTELTGNSLDKKLKTNGPNDLSIICGTLY